MVISFTCSRCCDKKSCGNRNETPSDPVIIDRYECINIYSLMPITLSLAFSSFSVLFHLLSFCVTKHRWVDLETWWLTLWGFSNCLWVVKGSSFICHHAHCEEYFMPREFLALNVDMRSNLFLSNSQVFCVPFSCHLFNSYELASFVWMKHTLLKGLWH